MNAMRHIVLLLALAVSAALPAKDATLTPAWNGIWTETTGQHRCAVLVADQTLRSRVTLLCQLGPDGVYAQGAVPAFGQPVYLRATLADFGQEPAGTYAWGSARIYAVCNEGRPEIIGTAYAGGIASDLRLHPVMPTGKLCGGAP